MAKKKALTPNNREHDDVNRSMRARRVAIRLSAAMDGIDLRSAEGIYNANLMKQQFEETPWKINWVDPDDGFLDALRSALGQHCDGAHKKIISREIEISVQGLLARASGNSAHG